MYKLINNRFENLDCIQRTSDDAFIPIDEANTDYQNFKKEVLAGAELFDADGNVMTQEQAKTYVATLP